MKRTKIIAEIGINHNGSFDVAKQMIETAKECGVDCVKFQMIKPELCISRYAPQASYQKENMGKAQSQLEMCRQFELPAKYFAEFKKICENLKIEFLVSPFDMESINYLQILGVDAYKVPSGEITNLPYLEKIGRTNKKVYLSTGMCDINEVKDAINILREGGCKEITALHCTSEYPAPLNEVNLNAIPYMREMLNIDVGYSDHTEGIEIAIAAAALGATVIEKHFTLDRGMRGPDHKASIEPDELKKMVLLIRNIEIAMGEREKKGMPGEEEIKNVARKSIVAKVKINKGDIYSDRNLAIKRPGMGISPMHWYDIIGKRANRNYEEDEMIDIKI